MARNVGTGNIYILNKTIKRLTKEKTWIDELVNAKILSPQEAMHHIKRKALIKYKGIEDDGSLVKLNGNIKKKDAFIICCEDLYFHNDEFPVCATVSNSRKVETEQITDVLKNSMTNGYLQDKASVILVGCEPRIGSKIPQ